MTSKAVPVPFTQAVIRFKDCPDDERLEKVCSHFRSSGKTVSDDYLGASLSSSHAHAQARPLPSTLSHGSISQVSSSFQPHHFFIASSLYLILTLFKMLQLERSGLRSYSTTILCTTQSRRPSSPSCRTI